MSHLNVLILCILLLETMCSFITRSYLSLKPVRLCGSSSRFVSLSGSRNKYWHTCLRLFLRKRFTNSPEALYWGCAGPVYRKFCLNCNLQWSLLKMEPISTCFFPKVRNGADFFFFLLFSLYMVDDLSPMIAVRFCSCFKKKQTLFFQLFLVHSSIIILVVFQLIHVVFL